MSVFKISDLPLLLFFFTMLISVTSGCDHRQQWENERAALQSQRIDLQARHDQLNARIDSLWDVTSDQLASEISMDFPALDRDIFINARNADHIRMFMSFQKLDTALQSLVNRAGAEDALLADQLLALLDAQRQYDVRKNQFLRKVERQDMSASKAYAELLRHSTQ